MTFKTIKYIGYLYCFVVCNNIVTAQHTTAQKRMAAWLQTQRSKILGVNAPVPAAPKTNKFTNNILQNFETVVCSSTGIFCAVVLPVDGLQLEGKRLNADKVQLIWHTLTETNNKGFVLERSFNGNIYDSVGFIVGVGNTQSKTNYNYYDANSYSQTSFYRVKQVDINGNFKYSNTIAMNGIVAPFSVSIAPNPTINGHIGLLFTGNGLNDKISVRIINATGKEVYTNENIGIGNAGKYSINNLILSAGLYMVSISNENYFKTLQLVVGK